jgi:hypothetical protein
MKWLRPTHLPTVKASNPPALPIHTELPVSFLSLILKQIAQHKAVKRFQCENQRPQKKVLGGRDNLDSKL